MTIIKATTTKTCLVSRLKLSFFADFSVFIMDFFLSKPDSGTGSSEDGDRNSRLDIMDRPSAHSDWNGSRNGSGPNSPDIYDHHRHPGLPHGPPHPLLHPSLQHLRPPQPSGSPPNPNQTPSGTTNANVIKPRIWSLADMASKENKEEPSNLSTNMSSLYQSQPGKILSPLASRGLHPMHHPYLRPELYRSFYAPTAAQLAANPHEAALFESYQRTFGVSLAHNGMAGVPLLPKSAAGPLSLTTSSQHSTLPPKGSPASSTSSSHDPQTPEKSMQSSTAPTTPVTPIPINATKP